MKRKILSIDGGGIKGIYAAKILADIERDCNVCLCDYFDIITGTSTGAIIACGLAVGMTASEILKLYTDEGKYIFAGYDTGRLTKLKLGLKMIFDSKYISCNLARCLHKQFGDRLFGECKTRVLIPAYNLSTGRVEVFKTAYDSIFTRDPKERIVDILMSSTAAPTYFPAYEFEGRGRYIDGGVGANNPAHIAVVEALTRCGWQAEDLHVLSIGCTDDYKKFLENQKVTGLKVADIISFFMRAESQYGENISRLLLNDSEKKRYMRINRVIGPNECSLDNVSEIAMKVLKNYAADDSKNYMERIKQTFFQEKKEEFVPVCTDKP